jgi:exodeoxyribonuclease VII large subunit
VRTRPVLRDPSATLDGHRERLTVARERLGRAIDVRLREERTGLAHAIERVRALSPKATLQRGYAILTDAGGGTVDRVSATAKGRKLTARMADGQLGLTVTKTEPTQTEDVEQP